jgi:hypothetical protein
MERPGCLFSRNRAQVRGRAKVLYDNERIQAALNLANLEHVRRAPPTGEIDEHQAA